MHHEYLKKERSLVSSASTPHIKTHLLTYSFRILCIRLFVNGLPVFRVFNFAGMINQMALERWPYVKMFHYSFMIDQTVWQLQRPQTRWTFSEKCHISTASPLRTRMVVGSGNAGYVWKSLDSTWMKLISRGSVARCALDYTTPICKFTA